MNNEVELYRKHRPRLFKHVLGQVDACRTLYTFLEEKKLPHALLFTGPSGVGKTTVARIIGEKLNCQGADFQEINAADSKGIDTIRDLRTRMYLHPMMGDVRIFLLDEAHKLTGDAQTALLKMLEDPPKTAYFILATTEPAKLLRTVVTRCTEVKFRELTPDILSDLLVDVCELEGKPRLEERVEARIVECSLGSGRMALVLLHKVLGITDPAEQMDMIDQAAASRGVIDLCKALLAKKSWKEVAAIIKSIEDEPESVRWAVLGYMTAVLLNSGLPRAFVVIEEFRDNFFDTKKAGLARAAYACCLGK